MTKDEAQLWLSEKKLHETDLRVDALVLGIDLRTIDCHVWSDNGPCSTCVVAAMRMKEAN